MFDLEPITLVLSVGALISAVLAIRAEMAGTETQVYIFKPLATILILLIALQAVDAPSTFYKWAIVAGLAFSLAGDILLMLPADLFLFGLISFLVAHILYIIGFSSVAGFYRSWIALLPFALYGLVMVVILWPGLGAMAVPALIYMVVILVMAWQALGQWQQTGETRALLAFIGALLFVVSDSTLALNRFGYAFDLSPLVVLSTYWSAQWLIALSAGNV